MVHATPRTLTNRFIPAYPRWDGTKKEVPRYISERIGPLLLNTLCERKERERETERTWRKKKRDERERRRLPRSSIHDASFAFTRPPLHVYHSLVLLRDRVAYDPAEEREKTNIDGSIDFCQRPSFFNRSHSGTSSSGSVYSRDYKRVPSSRPYFVLSLTSSSSFF